VDGPTCLLNGQKKKSVPEYTAERVQSEGHMKENPRYIQVPDHQVLNQWITVFSDTQ